MKEFEREVTVLGGLHHPHLLQLLGSCPTHGMLVYELMEGGSLEDRLFGDRIKTTGSPKREPLQWQDRVRICFEVAAALHHLHSNGTPVVHKDVKPANILLDRQGGAKLGDVGFAVVLPSAETFVQATAALKGTPMFMDPDYLRTGAFSPKSDTYALGITMLQCLTRRQDMRLVDAVESAVERITAGNAAGQPPGGDPWAEFEALMDPTAGAWPRDHALRFARLALRCAEVYRSARPGLQDEVLPLLTRLVAEAEEVAEQQRRDEEMRAAAAGEVMRSAGGSRKSHAPRSGSQAATLQQGRPPAGAGAKSSDAVVIQMPLDGGHRDPGAEGGNSMTCITWTFFIVGFVCPLLWLVPPCLPVWARRNSRRVTREDEKSMKWSAVMSVLCFVVVVVAIVVAMVMVYVYHSMKAASHGQVKA